MGETVGAVTLLTRKPFPFLILLWSLYPSKPGQAIPSALCHFKLAKTVHQALRLILIKKMMIPAANM